MNSGTPDMMAAAESQLLKDIADVSKKIRRGLAVPKPEARRYAWGTNA